MIDRYVFSPQAFSVRCREIRVVFDRDEDRWAHRVELVVDEARMVPLFSSVEGELRADTPSSPPVQELQLQESPDGTYAVLGVGMAGRNHWSVACGVHRTDESLADADSILWEVACRVREGRPALASTYRLLPPARVTAVASGVLELAVAERRLRLIFTDASLSITSDVFAFAAPVDPQHALPRTVQWSYSIEQPSIHRPRHPTAARGS